MPDPLHERAELRAAAIAQLVGETAAEDRVTSSRLAPHPKATLPAISVFTEDEAIDEASKNTHPRELKRRPVLAIEAWVSVPAGGDVDGAMDAIALEIETAMDQDIGINGTAGDSVLSGTQMGMKLDGDRPMGCVRLEYDVTYRTDLRIGEPEDEFDTLGVSTSLGGEQDDEDDQAQDLVEDIHE